MSFEGVVIHYPAPAADLGSRMAAALETLAPDALTDCRARLSAYADTLSINDILALRGAAFRKLDADARKEAARARR